MSKVLLIEDEAGIRRSLTVSMMQEGHEVIPCEDGLTGLSKMDNYVEKGEDFDAVILDINLPDINGLKVLRFLKEKHPEIPVIMITGYGDEAMREEVIERKGDAYFEKPLEMDKLDTYLQSILDRKDEILGDKEEEIEEQKMATRSGYAFIKLAEDSDFVDTYQKLYFHPNTVYCDATRGIFDLVLLFHGKSAEEMDEHIENVQNLKGVEEVVYSSVERPIISEDIQKVISQMDRFLIEDNANKDFKGEMSKSHCSAYAMLEIEPEKFESIFRQVYFMDNVVSCDTLKGPFQMALLMKAGTYDEIAEIVTGKIARLDGVLRATHCNIINLLEA